jgi:hypothetical protein
MRWETSSILNVLIQFNEHLASLYIIRKERRGRRERRRKERGGEGKKRKKQSEAEGGKKRVVLFSDK